MFLILISLFWWPWAVVPFEVPKVTLFLWFVKLLTVIFAFSFITKKHDWKIDKKIAIPVILFLIWSTIISFFGSNITKSFLGNYYRNDGLITLFHLVGFSFLVSYFWEENFKKKISLAFFISSLILSLISTIEISIGKFGLGEAATFGNPVLLAGYLAVSLPFSFYLFKETGQKYYLISTILSIVTITLTGAVSAIVTVILFVGLVALFYLRKYKYLSFIFLAFSILILSLWIRNYYIKNDLVFNAQGRDRIYRSVINAVIEKPLTGYGWSNVDYAFESATWPMKYGHDIYVDKAHSEFLEILATTGIFGGIFYLILIISIFIKLKNTKDLNWKYTLLITLILYLFHSQTNVISIMEQIIFWLVAGITLLGV